METLHHLFVFDTVTQRYRLAGQAMEIPNAAVINNIAATARALGATTEIEVGLTALAVAMNEMTANWPKLLEAFQAQQQAPSADSSPAPSSSPES
jgi:hypothetical protein